MKAVLLLALLALPALAQEPSPRDHKIAQACRFDVHLWCDDARLRQECLVTLWNKLTRPCQDALVLPAREGGGEGVKAPPKN